MVINPLVLISSFHIYSVLYSISHCQHVTELWQLWQRVSVSVIECHTQTFSMEGCHRRVNTMDRFLDVVLSWSEMPCTILAHHCAYLHRRVTVMDCHHTEQLELRLIWGAKQGVEINMIWLDLRLLKNRIYFLLIYSSEFVVKGRVNLFWHLS